MNENYPLAGEHDPDFDQPHPYTKSFGDGSIRHHCRCERHVDDPIHDVSPSQTLLLRKEENKKEKEK